MLTHSIPFTCLQWLSVQNNEPACPVCKAVVEIPNFDPSKAKVIPLYVNGKSETDPRTCVPLIRFADTASSDDSHPDLCNLACSHALPGTSSFSRQGRLDVS